MSSILAIIGSQVIMYLLVVFMMWDWEWYTQIGEWIPLERFFYLLLWLFFSSWFVAATLALYLFSKQD